jgi:ABC-type branched-subunit amino acid transport system ATPase component
MDLGLQGKTAVITVLVEQNVHQSLRLADRVYVLENGRIVITGGNARRCDYPGLGPETCSGN